LSCVLSTSAVRNISDGKTTERVLSTEDVVALGLVADGKIERADLVEAEGAGAVLDVVKSGVLADPGVGTAADIVADGVGSHERQLAIRGLDEVGALAHVDGLILGRNAATHGGVVSSRLAGVEVVPGVVADVVGTTRRIDLEEVDRATICADLDADAVASGRHGPVGDAVGVDVASKDTDRRRIFVMGSDGDTSGAGNGGHGQSLHDSREHFDKKDILVFGCFKESCV